MSISSLTTATSARKLPVGSGFGWSLLSLGGAIVIAAALGGCSDGYRDPALASTGFQRGGVEAPWQVAGPVVAAHRTNKLGAQTCYDGAWQVDDCDPYSVRYTGP